jgi:hypothetical protein
MKAVERRNLIIDRKTFVMNWGTFKIRPNHQFEMIAGDIAFVPNIDH